MPCLDEDLSFRGLLRGEYGQHQIVNEITGANAAGLRPLPMQTPWAARVAQFGRSMRTPSVGSKAAG